MFDHPCRAQRGAPTGPAAPKGEADTVQGPIVEYYPEYCCVFLSNGTIVELTYPQLETLQIEAEAMAADAMLPFAAVFEELVAVETQA